MYFTEKYSIYKIIFNIPVVKELSVYLYITKMSTYNDYVMGEWKLIPGRWVHVKAHWHQIYIHKKYEWVWINDDWWYDSPRWEWFKFDNKTWKYF